MPRYTLPAGCPSQSPWGAVDSGTLIAPGWWAVSTPSHGGFYLEHDRWLQMPEFMRETSYSRFGWFEEDCDWCLPVVCFPREFALFVSRNPGHYAADFDPISEAEATFVSCHKERAAQLTLEAVTR